MHNREIEVRFLEIDKKALVPVLLAMGAEDLGDKLLEEIIFYDQDNTWQDQHRLIRLRKTGSDIFMTYKHNQAEIIDGTHEIELKVDSIEKAEDFLLALGFVYAMRHQQKRRHSFKLPHVIVDFDTWPKVPEYVEIEGETEEAIKSVAEKMGLSWEKAVFVSARGVIENHYGIPIMQLKYFTFDRIE